MSDNWQVADGVVRVAGSRTNLYVVFEGDSVCLVTPANTGIWIRSWRLSRTWAGRSPTCQQCCSLTLTSIT